MIEREDWRPVVGFHGYLVSSFGRVKSLKGREPRLMRPRVLEKGYLRVTLTTDGEATYRRVHHLVAGAFIGPRPDGLQVRHLNGDPADNRLVNLAYGTHSENELDKVRHGTHVHARKTHCPRRHPYDEANTIVMRGRRHCRECRREADSRRSRSRSRSRRPATSGVAA